MTKPIITIKEEHTIENTINKSRFISHIKPVASEDEAKAFINEVKSQHKDATHNCSAYTVGPEMNIQKQMTMENQVVLLASLCWKY